MKKLGFSRFFLDIIYCGKCDKIIAVQGLFSYFVKKRVGKSVMCQCPPDMSKVMFYNPEITPLMQIMKRIDDNVANPIGNNLTWIDLDIPSYTKIKGIEGCRSGLKISVDEAWKYLRKNDLLYSPRLQIGCLVASTPTSNEIEVIYDWPRRTYASAADVAKNFYVTPRTVMGWCKKGHIPAEKKRGKWMIDIVMILDSPIGLMIGDTLIITGCAEEEK